MTFHLLKTDTAPKTGLNAVGGITYAVLRDEAGDDLYLYLLANASGGYFNREPVRLDDIQACLTGLDPTRPIPAKAFTRAFKGKSANNSGFLCAVLRHEGLLAPWPEATHQHQRGDADWDAWAASMRSHPAQPFTPPTQGGRETAPRYPTASDAPVVPLPEHKKDSKGRRKGAEPTTTTSEENSHDSPH